MPSQPILPTDPDADRDFALQILNAMGQGVIVTDADGRFEYVNPAFTRLTGYSSDALVGRTPMELTIPNFAPQLDDALAQRRNGAVSSSEIRIRHADGRVLPALITGVPRIHDGRYLGSIAVVTDLSPHKQSQTELEDLNAALTHRIREHTAELENANRALAAERAQLAQRVAERTADLSAANAELARAARAKDEFLASISHELRTPLNTILGMTEALLEGVFGHLFDEQREALNNIDESGKHLLEMINDLLDLSKVEAGKMELQLGPVNVAAVCTASQRLVEQALQAKAQRLVTFIDPAVTELVADSRRLRQMLVNLLANAVKFTPEGGSLGLEVMGDAEGEAVRFTVWDSGIGISPADAGRLFKPFTQLDTGLARQYSGTGLGLMLVYRMAELHGGSITLESQPEHGSRFTVALPWSGPDRGVAVARAVSPGLQEITHVLVVEDSPAVGEALTRLLNEAGVRATTQTRLEGLVERGAAVAPEVILLDTMLPDGSGWEALAGLKADPRTAVIPVVMMSASDEQSLSEAAGAIACLIKPISRDALRAALSRVVEAQLAETDPGVETLPPVPTDASLVLLADDNERVLLELSRGLRRAGYRVTVARTGLEAVERAREETPAALVLDLQMPGPDGAEVLRQIRADARLASVPIVASSALIKSGDRERALLAGANDFCAKPMSASKLTQMLAAQRRPAVS
jgi:PAS domain S-box-containing protein